ncbi:MAG: DUF6489 family protein [Candidatus Sphingomonas colombiensis]|nr:DUF6489 family protein [Sphingomonas sp.]WEK44525.1 MAG: DUF6489 family protein [Sphingomonas sp.]
MKVNVEVDCTPEEARRLMGLPDLTPIHEAYIAKMKEAMDGGMRPEMFENIVKNWAPMGEAGLSFWQRLFEAGTKPGG